MDDFIKLVLFKIEREQYALPVDVIDRIVQVVELVKIPDSADYLSGLVNFHGELVPVLNLRRLFNHSVKEIQLTDQLIILNTKTMKMALLVDETIEVKDVLKEQFITIEDLNFDNKFVHGIVKIEPDTLVINSPEIFLNQDEITALTNFVQKGIK